jgi:hypothetical protein
MSSFYRRRAKIFCTRPPNRDNLIVGKSICNRWMVSLGVMGQRRLLRSKTTYVRTRYHNTTYRPQGAVPSCNSAQVKIQLEDIEAVALGVKNHQRLCGSLPFLPLEASPTSLRRPAKLGPLPLSSPASSPAVSRG